MFISQQDQMIFHPGVYPNIRLLHIQDRKIVKVTPISGKRSS